MNRQLSRDEFQKILQRWHQLRNQFGEHAINVPEFAHLSKIIKFLQQQNSQIQRQQSQPQDPQMQQKKQQPQHQQLAQQVQQPQRPLPQQQQQRQQFNSQQMVNPQVAFQHQAHPQQQQQRQQSLQKLQQLQQQQQSQLMQSPQQLNTTFQDAPVSGNGSVGRVQGPVPHRNQVMGGADSGMHQTVSPHIQSSGPAKSSPMVIPKHPQQVAFGTNGDTGIQPQVSTQSDSAFTPQQFQLVKAQYQALKFLVKKPETNGQSIPQNLIDFITNNSVPFPEGPYLSSISQGPHPPQIPVSQSPMPSQVNVNSPSVNTTSPAVTNSQSIPKQYTTDNIYQGGQEVRPQDARKTPQSRTPSNPYIKARTNSRQSITDDAKSIPKSSTSIPIYLDPEPPINIDDLVPDMEKNSKMIVPVNKPKAQVDCFEFPKLTDDTINDINFNAIYAPQTRLQFPGLLPESFSMEELINKREIITMLKIDNEINSLKEKLKFLGEFDDKRSDIEAQRSDIEAQITKLELLPSQKELRGRILAHTWFGQSLLPNTHPNFLAKFTNVTFDNVTATYDLYRHQLDSLAQEQNQKHRSSIRSIIENSERRAFKGQKRKEKRDRFSTKVASFHGHAAKEEQKKVERMAKQRLQALKSNDEEEYLKLLDHTKDTRITHLLRQTNQFLDSLAKAVETQQKETKENLVQDGRVEKDGPSASISEDEKREKLDYYHIAHKIKEDVTIQPSILVGGTLKEYQMKGLQWMVSLFNNHLNGILADEMGLGKTIQTISLITFLVERKHIPGPFLVIVPLSTLTNWNLEFDKWAPTVKKITYKGTPTQRKALQYEVKQGNFQILLTTYEYVIKDRNLLSKVKWVHMIIDEGHRMKNSSSKLSETLTYHYHSDYRLILTGTPLQNNLPELWALLNFVLPKIFNSVKSFDEWFNTPFANTGGQDKIELSEEETLLVIRRLHKVLRPFLLRRLKKDVEKDLPNKVEKVVKCKMSTLQSRLYEQMLKYNLLFSSDVDGTPVMIKNANNQIMQLRKICNHPFVYEEVERLINPTNETNDQIWRVAGKFELLDRVLPKFKATGHRVLIFFQMTQIMDIMEDFLLLRGLKYLRLDGATKADDRTGLLRQFNGDDSDYFCFLLSTRAGGLGLNLQSADTVIIFDTDWNPHQDLQAQDRAHRIGQKNEVRILRLITENSVEEMILERAYAKLEIDGKVIQAGKFDNKSTSEEQEALLRALLEKEEERKQKGSYENSDELDEEELNSVIARNDDELMTFRKLDEAKMKEIRDSIYPSRLFSEGELPAVYKKDPEEILKKDEIVQEYGRGTRERKPGNYDDNLTEEQWLKKINGLLSDNSEDEDGEEKPKRSRSRKKPKIVDAESDDEGVHRSRSLSKRKLNNDDDQDSTSIKRPKSSTPAYRGKSKGRGKTKGGFNRSTPSVDPLTSNERSKLQDVSEAIYEAVLDYHNDEGRVLSDLFLVKPSKKLYPDYYVLIKHPIALDVVRKRINTKCYVHVKELLEDFHLMFNNAKIYNEEGSLVYHDAMTLENLVNSKFKELSPQLNTEDIESILDFSIFDETISGRKPLNPNVEELQNGNSDDLRSPSVGI